MPLCRVASAAAPTANPPAVTPAELKAVSTPRAPTPPKIYFLSEPGHKRFPSKTGHKTQATNPKPGRVIVQNASMQGENSVEGRKYKPPAGWKKQTAYTSRTLENPVLK